MVKDMIDPKKLEKRFTFDDIKELLNIGNSYWELINKETLEDISFSYATDISQWDPKSLANRGGRPTETYNIVNGFIRPIVNLIKQNPPAINVFPIADGASKTNAKLVSGIIRAIEYGCNAQTAYCSALNFAARGGLAILRVIIKESEVDGSADFNIVNVIDPSKVLIDPSATKSDFSDANWVVVKSDMSLRQYKKDYPDGRATGINDSVEINELWIKSKVPVHTIDARTGRPVTKSKVQIIQYVFDDYEILERNDSQYPGKILPFAIVTGDRYIVDGQVHFASLTREVRGIQKEVNFLKSEMISAIACAPKATFYGDSNVFETPEEQQAWEESAINPRVFLGHKPGGSVNQFNMPQIPTAYIEACKDNIELARIITGIYPDPSTQDGLSAVSGKAIKQQQAGQSIATYSFVDSLNHAIKHIGEIILDLLPYYYNDNEIRLSMGVDGQYTSVSMGDQEVEGATNFDLNYGKYSVSISTGPSYASQKDALIEIIMDAVKQNPQALSIALPWIINQVNLPGSEELSDMFALTLPPDIQKFMAQMKQSSQDPEEQLKAAIMQINKLGSDGQMKDQMIDKLTEALQNETAELKSKQAEIQAKANIENDKAQSQIILETIKHQHELEMEQMKARMSMMEKMLDIKQQDKMFNKEAIKEATLAQVNHTNSLEATTHAAKLDIVKDTNKALIGAATTAPKATPDTNSK